MTEKKIRVTFILPGRGSYPVGGFRVVYEYANRLSKRGLDVSIVHTAWLYKSHSFFIGIGRYIYCLLFYRFYKKWFTLSSDVNDKWVFIPKSLFIPDAEFIVATSWETAENVIEYPESKGKKLYLIQGNESEFAFAKENGLQQRVLDTWNFDMQKIVIGSWLQEKVRESGNNAEVIFNGLNFEDFSLENEIEKRNPNTVMMLFHESYAKGCEEGLKVLRGIRSNNENLKVILFGVPQKPDYLEDWIEYHRMPSRSELKSMYNRSSIFLSPSHSEGWGLPVAEAMQCGCAVLTSDIGGFMDFVIDQDTGLCFKVQDIDDMSEKLLLLMNNKELRLKLARNGNLFIRRFNWELSADNMVKFLKKII